MHNLLGFDAGDVGLPSNICILEENTLLKLLNILKDKGGIVRQDFAFISAGCESKVPEFVKAIDALDTILKCHPLYKDNYYIITDNISDKSNGTYKRLCEVNRNGVTRYFPLSSGDVEMYYGNIGPEYKKYERKDEIKKLLGKDKNDLALEIAEKIKTEGDFQKLFAGELGFLLKSKEGSRPD